MNISEICGTWKEVANDDQPPEYSFVMTIQPNGVVVSRLSYAYGKIESSTEWRFENPDWFITTIVAGKPDDPQSIPMREVNRRRIRKLSKTELVFGKPGSDLVSSYVKIG